MINENIAMAISTKMVLEAKVNHAKAIIEANRLWKLTKCNDELPETLHAPMQNAMKDLSIYFNSEEEVLKTQLYYEREEEPCKELEYTLDYLKHVKSEVFPRLQQMYGKLI